MKTFLFIVLKIVIILLLAFWSVIAIMAFFEVPMLFWTTVILYGLIIYLWIFYKKIKSLPILSKNAKVPCLPSILEKESVLYGSIANRRSVSFVEANCIK